MITAGHCIHTGSGGVWATSATVVPAYDSSDEPFGQSAGVSLLSWTGWTQDGDLDFDIGVVEIERPVGALTGWRGVGTTNIEDYFLEGMWEQPGYPGEGPYDGERMYNWTGFFDECDTIFGLWFGNECSHERLSYGGQSGSGAVKGDVVWAVLSNGTSTTTSDPRIVSAEFDDIVDAITEHTSSSLDLAALNARAFPPSATAGAPLVSFDYYVYNNSTSTADGTYEVAVYLSTNDLITAGDTLLQTHSFSWNFGPKEGVRVNVSTPPTIPAGLSGDMWVGVVLSVADSSPSNNATDGFDASQITVVDAPFLIFQDGFESGDLSGW